MGEHHQGSPSKTTDGMVSGCGAVGIELQGRQRAVSVSGRASRPAGEQAHSPTSQSRALGHSPWEDKPEGQKLG